MYTLFRNTALLISCSLCLLCSCNQETNTPVDKVNPFVDTHKSRWFFFASAARPFGMVSLSPDTWVKGSWDSGYLYDSLHVRCFSHIHAWQMSGIPVMPAVGEFKGHLGMEAYKSAFSHEDETAFPGYHSIYLKDYNIKAELTSTSRVGFHRYAYPEDSVQYVIFDVGAYLGHGPMESAMVEKVSDYEIAGYSIMAPTRRRPKPTHVYFVARFDRPISEFGAWKNGVLMEDVDEISGSETGAFVSFDSKKSTSLKMKVAISYTGVKQARGNMEQELGHWNFERVVKASRKEWNSYLGRIRIKGGTEKQQVKFYTDLWHALLGRKIVSDVDGSYCDMTGERPEIRQLRLDKRGNPVHQQYNFDALWGSHWTLNVLWSMVYPDVMNEFCASMVEMYRYGGLIPRGPSGGNYTYVMIGDPASSFFATAYNKGIKNYDVELAYDGLFKNAFTGGIRNRAGYEHGNRPIGGGMEYYLDRAYVPEGIGGTSYHRDGAAMTLEYAYQDWCLGQMSLGMDKTSDYHLFNERAQNYRKLWNLESGYMHPRKMDGDWIPDFSPIGDGFNTLGFVESNAAIYTNYVPHDLDGLMELFGGKEVYTSYVDSCFIKAREKNFITDHKKHAQNWVDYENQPSCQMAHIFNHSGAPWLSQYWVREVKETTFSDITPYGGYNGDEDQGQMGALGVLMAIGLFQMDGGAGVNSSYEITAPIFEEVEIDLDPAYYPGDQFSIVTENNAANHPYIQHAEFKGREWNSVSLPHEDLVKGGELRISLGKDPNKSWGN